MTEVTHCGIKVGDIFVSSWGYDQTNVDFYQVVKLVGKSTIELLPIQSKCIEHEHMYWRELPIPDEFTSETPFRKRVPKDFEKFGYIKLNSFSLMRKAEKDEKGNYKSHYASNTY